MEQASKCPNCGADPLILMASSSHGSSGGVPICTKCHAQYNPNIQGINQYVVKSIGANSGQAPKYQVSLLTPQEKSRLMEGERKNMTITELQKKAHKNALDKGFWEKSQNISEKLMLIVSELGEACEALRNNETAKPTSEDLAFVESAKDDEEYACRYRGFVKGSFDEELADVLIRLVDLAEFLNIDLEKNVLLKMRFNESRPYLHGKGF